MTRTTASNRVIQHPSLKAPILIHLTHVSHREVIATFEEAEIAMSGDDVEDAIQGLLDEILDTLDDFLAERANLGPGPRRQLAVLQEYVVHGLEEEGCSKYRREIGVLHQQEFTWARQGFGENQWTGGGSLWDTPGQSIRPQLPSGSTGPFVDRDYPAISVPDVARAVCAAS